MKKNDHVVALRDATFYTSKKVIRTTMGCKAGQVLRIIDVLNDETPPKFLVKTQLEWAKTFKMKQSSVRQSCPSGKFPINKVGGFVQAKIDLNEYNDHQGNVRLANMGDELVVHSIHTDTGIIRYGVAHEGRLDATFSVAESEVLRLLHCTKCNTRLKEIYAVHRDDKLFCLCCRAELIV